ncbi:MAG TPA: cyclic nucleotide-binding domain-containing protein [Verrucomicrobiae bacterium]|nr:cyclic nucleotide-binding domain-containing protein [Verrucomicrobiae bacterium]
MGDSFRIAIVGSGPSGLSAAARAAELGLSYVLLEAEPHLSNTIFRYQKGKHVMAEPGVLPLRSPLPFEAGRREQILSNWAKGAAALKLQARMASPVTAIAGQKGGFTLTLKSGATLTAEFVVLAIGLQGNIRKLGVPGEDAPFVQYQLDDPDEYQDESIVIVGAGDAGIENALALMDHNRVTILNRDSEFTRAKEANNAAVIKAIGSGQMQCLYKAAIAKAEPAEDGPGGRLTITTDSGEVTVDCRRVIARLGAMPPRKFVESCGVEFPSKDPNSVPAVSPNYESNVSGLYIVGALAGFPLIKQAMNQGFEVIEFIEGRNVEPADTPLLRAKFERVPHWGDIDAALLTIQSRVPVLAPLTPLQLREFLLDSDVRTPAPGEALFRRNDYTDSFYSIVEGTVEVEIDPADPLNIVRLKAGDFFGEMSLISGRRRSATVRAGDDCVLIETPRRSMNKLINSVADVKRVVDEVFIRRAIQTHFVPNIDAAVLAPVVATARIERFRANDVLFRQGDPGDCLHLVRKGSVMITRDVGGRDVVLAYVPAGQYVGEMALMSEGLRTATVRAAVATETIRLEGEPFKELMDREPEIRDQVARTYKDRLTANVHAQHAKQEGGVIGFLLQQGVGEATDVLLIDEGLCVRCDQCEKACADTHGNVSRLDREAGPTFQNLHVPTSCRHCEHPHCMKDCPPDAIRRSASGEVFITDSCIGCGNCERNCPYGVIQMGVMTPEAPSLWRWMLFGQGSEPGRHEPGYNPDAAKKAAKCDMCKDLTGGPACVRACPTGAAIRVSPEDFMRVARTN